MNYFIINVDFNGIPQALRTVYCNIRHFMVTNYLPFAGGYIVPDEEAADCLKTLTEYKKRWIEQGGTPAACAYMRFILQCDNSDTYEAFKDSIVSAVRERLEKTLSTYESKTELTGSYLWAGDKRTHKALRKTKEYIDKFVPMHPLLLSGISGDLSGVLDVINHDPETAIKGLRNVVTRCA